MCPAGDSGAAQRAHHPASLQRRALALIYETLLLVALLLIGSLPFVIFARDAGWTDARPLFQVYLVALTGAYYVWQWRRGGQTLALKTWRLRIVTRNGAPLTWAHAFRRFVIALPGTLLIGAGFLWALVDREGLFLHDRLAGTKIVNSDP
jgi:uncharacterized RDD family membrane protein YckC